MRIRVRSYEGLLLELDSDVSEIRDFWVMQLTQFGIALNFGLMMAQKLNSQT